MLAGTRDITIYQGDSWDMLIGIKDTGVVPAEYQDLTDFVGLAQIRATEDANTTLAEMTVTLSDQGTLPGRVVLSLTPADTASLPPTGGVWDVELTSPPGYTGALEGTHTYLKGKVTVIKEVSRP